MIFFQGFMPNKLQVTVILDYDKILELKKITLYQVIKKIKKQSKNILFIKMYRKNYLFRIKLIFSKL